MQNQDSLYTMNAGWAQPENGQTNYIRPLRFRSVSIEERFAGGLNFPEALKERSSNGAQELCAVRLSSPTMHVGRPSRPTGPLIAISPQRHLPIFPQPHCWWPRLHSFYQA